MSTKLATAIIEFTAEDSKLRKSLEGIQRENKVVSETFKSLGRDASAVFGSGLEQKAQQAAAAIKLVGGATKLTDDEARKHLATLDAWIAKSKALGKDVSSDILSTRAALASVNAEGAKSPGMFQTIGGSALKMAGTMGIAFSAGAVVSFTKNLADAAGDVLDLADKTGLSTDSIQRMQHVASKTGATLDTFTNSAFKLGVKLAGGGDSVEAAVTKLGLSYDTLKAMRPDEQFERIVKQLELMENPQERNRLAVELFGKAAADILPAIAQGYSKIADGANIAKREQLEALDEAAEAWDDFVARQKKGMTAWLGNRVIIAQQLKKLTDDEKARLLELTGGGSITGDAEEYLLRLARRKDINLPAPAPAGPNATTSTDYIAELVKARAEVDRLSAAQLAQIAAAEAMGASTEEITAQFKISEAALRVLNETQRSAAKALRDGAAAIKLYAAEQENAVAIEKKWADAKAVMAKITHRFQQDTTKALVDEQQRRLDASNTAMDAEAKTLAAFQEKNLQALLTGSELRLRQIEVEEAAVIATLKTQGFWHQEAAKQIKTYYDQLRLQVTLPSIGQQLPLPQPPAVPADWGKELRATLKGHAKQLGQDVSNTLAENIASGDWSQFENQMKGVFANFMGSAMSSGINMIIPGLGSMLQPLLGAISDKILGALGLGTAGRDLVKDFAASFGGFDAMHKELNKLGVEGERLWIALTQGVGRNNPEQAMKAIEAIRAALENMPLTLEQQAAGAGFQTVAQLKAIAADAVKLAKDMEASGLYSAQAVTQAWERANQALAASGDQTAIAAGKAKAAIAELKSEYDSLSVSVAAETPEYDQVTGEREYGVIEAQQMARMAQIEEEMAAKQAAIEAEMAAREEADRAAAEGAASAAEQVKLEGQGIYEHLSELFGKGFRIPLTWDVPSSPFAMPSGGFPRGSKRPNVARVLLLQPGAYTPVHI